MRKKRGSTQRTFWRSDEGKPLTIEEFRLRDALSKPLAVPPFTLFDSRMGYWQERKKAWLSLGIQSELGRGWRLPKANDTILQSDEQECRAKLVHVTRRASGKIGDIGGGLGGGSVPANIEVAVGSTFYKKLSAGYSREEILLDWMMSDSSLSAGISVFNPVLCECVYTWFCPAGGRVLDPFAGGSVRGIVAARLGREYVGIDLSKQQIEANREQARAILSKDYPEPRWIVGDSRQVNSLLPEYHADLVFTCPPYFNLEVYGDDKADLSNARDYSAFKAALQEILHLALARLKPNRFACLVVQNIRDERGMYRNLVADTVNICENGGVWFYNDAVMVTPCGSLQIRVARIFNASRKLGKTHQNVLIFCKGDPKKAVASMERIDLNSLGVQDDNSE